MKRACVAVVVALSLLVVTGAGCATIVSGTTQSITIESNPPGAHVEIGHQSGTTPVTMQITKGKDFPVEVSFGQNRKVVMLTRTVDPVTFLNFIPPFWPGFIVDAVTGAMTKYEPEFITVDFQTTQTARFPR